MAKVAVLNIKGEKIEDLEINDNVWNIDNKNDQVLYDAVRTALCGLRQGTHSTKTRAEVRGGGKKPWRQKGTGRARVGSTRSPIWRGGGITFGPKPRDYSIKMNRKERQLALKTALSYKFIENELLVVDNINLENHKTKTGNVLLENLKVSDNALFVTHDVNENLILATRNIEKVMVLETNNMDILSLLKYNYLVVTKDAIKKIEEVLA